MGTHGRDGTGFRNGFIGTFRRFEFISAKHPQGRSHPISDRRTVGLLFGKRFENAPPPSSLEFATAAYFQGLEAEARQQQFSARAQDYAGFGTDAAAEQPTETGSLCMRVCFIIFVFAVYFLSRRPPETYDTLG